MSEHEPGDEHHRHESALLHAQEHKGYGADEGEREELLERERDEEPRDVDPSGSAARTDAGDLG